MRIEQHHGLGTDEVKKRGDALADSLITLPLPGDIEITNLVKQWNGEAMDFSFRISKGFFGANIKGQVIASDDAAVLEIAIPPLVAKFIDENQIRTVLEKKMADALA